MTVAELIARLQTMPMDGNVWTPDREVIDVIESPFKGSNDVWLRLAE